jgi:Protein of unknown function (DUF2917)
MMLSALNPVVPLHNPLAWLPKTLANSANSRVTLKPANCDTQHLQRGTALDLPEPMGYEVECLDGSVWITHVGDTKDLVLEAGQFYHVDSPQRMLAYALETSDLQFRTA